MPKPIMHSLRHSLGLCSFINGKIHPCDYHKKKWNSSIHKLSDSSGLNNVDDSNHQIHFVTPDIIKLSKLFNSSKDPAGGWYLVQEQRMWLEEELVSIFSNYLNSKTNCRILVAGVASYVHFYTFLKIVISAADISKLSLTKLEIDVVDKCIYPLNQIAAIESNLRNKHKFLFRNSFSVFNEKIKIPRDNLKFLKKIRNDVRKINIRLFLRDLRQLEDIHALGKYSIITEHFLTSMLYKQEGLIKKTRESYKNLIDRNGSLLIATGVPNNDFFLKFIDLHENNGFKLVEKKTKWVWDPYGHAREQLETLLFNPKSNFTTLVDNALLRFDKV
ncbi:hypothetical protein [uncultured Winogradskyella sp.]|uniref:hypothetical protein n=1 Tax=uncultured Winogradskyella sp. TaxID=395353 RepID=UPI0026055AC0|nr:hypothetical protein [uncultured Winogradskyella sp.]